MRVEILVIGREILTGHTSDTNSHRLAATLWGLGTAPARITVLDDAFEAIRDEVSAARARGTGLLITTGGLGPTDDDLTLAAVAAAAGRALELHPRAEVLVAERYRELAARGAVADPTLTPRRRKMAVLPAGAEPLANPVGAAPAVLLSERGLTIVCLPGVPAELVAILEGPLKERLRTLLGATHTCAITVPSGIADESVLGDVLRRAAAGVPGVHLKSIATGFGPSVNLAVRITASAATVAEAQARTRAAREALAREIAAIEKTAVRDR